MFHDYTGGKIIFSRKVIYKINTHLTIVQDFIEH